MLIVAVVAAQNVPATLRGQVRDILGSVIAGAQAELWSGKEPKKVLRGQTNGSGTYAFEGLLEGEYTLRLSSPGFKSLTVASIHIPAAEHVSLPNLTLSVGGGCGDRPVLDHLRFLPEGVQGGDLGGTVRLDLGAMADKTAPVSDADVALVCGEDTPCHTARSDSQGRFLFENLAPGMYAVGASRPGFYAEFQSDYEVQRGYERIYYPIRLEQCFQGNCDPALRPKKPISVCE